MERQSKKRQSILEYLRGTREHPSAETIYNALKKEYPKLSLATVYRNLIFLREKGLVRSLGKVRGQERFDATVIPHTHGICTCCGKVIDIGEDFISPEILEKAGAMSGFSFVSSELQFTGLCEECRKKNNGNLR